MKHFSEIRDALAASGAGEHVEPVQGRDGCLTARVRGVSLHSRYNPVEEARRLVEGVEPASDGVLLVAGLGLGYHVEALLARGCRIVVFEPDLHVAALAAQRLPRDLDFPLVTGDPVTSLEDEELRTWLCRAPVVLVHPATARLHPRFVDAVKQLPAAAVLRDRPLAIAVVGAMQGGSVPISGYLSNAFRSLGHHVAHIENACVLPVFEAARGSVKGQKPSAQLTNLLTQFMSEWTYARVAEFNPDLCIVLAQAPVSNTFPERLRQHNILSAYWYVENWRHMPYWHEIAPLYDCFFHIQPGPFEAQLDEAGCPAHAFVQTGCDPEAHRPVTLQPFEREEFESDISFAGAGYANRVAFFRGLTDYAFKLWGVNWNDRYLSSLLVGGERWFDNEYFMKIVAGAKVNLNLHSSTTHTGVDPKCDAINPRVFEIAAAGGFQLCDPAPGLEKHFDFTEELPTYRTLKELRAHIDHFLKHPEERAAIAERARARAVGEHTYACRARQMLDVLLTKYAERIEGRGGRVLRSVAEMATRLDAGDPLTLWLRTLPQDTPFTGEHIEAALRPGMLKQLSYPEKVFAYLKEVRAFAETMMKEKR